MQMNHHYIHNAISSLSKGCEQNNSNKFLKCLIIMTLLMNDTINVFVLNGPSAKNAKPKISSIKLHKKRVLKFD